MTADTSMASTMQIAEQVRAPTNHRIIVLITDHTSCIKLTSVECINYMSEEYSGQNVTEIKCNIFCSIKAGQNVQSGHSEHIYDEYR